MAKLANLQIFFYKYLVRDWTKQGLNIQLRKFNWKIHPNLLKTDQILPLCIQKLAVLRRSLVVKTEVFGHPVSSTELHPVEKDIQS